MPSTHAFKHTNDNSKILKVAPSPSPSVAIEASSSQMTEIILGSDICAEGFFFLNESLLTMTKYTSN